MQLKSYPFDMKYITLNNHQSVPVNSIPELKYDLFLELNITLMEEHPERHCVLYFGYRVDKEIRLICCIADDITHSIIVSSSMVLSILFLQKTYRLKNLNARSTKISGFPTMIIPG
jgi:hypothetical protein